MASDTLTIFAHGSLMKEGSLLRTAPHAEVVGIDILLGYQRMFTIQSPSRRNPETGIYSSVLNLVEAAEVATIGIVFTLARQYAEELFKREEGYDLVKVSLASGQTAETFIMPMTEPYWYVENDWVQREYLDMCLTAAETIGPEAYQNFVTTTYVSAKKTVADLLSNEL